MRKLISLGTCALTIGLAACGGGGASNSSNSTGSGGSPAKPELTVAVPLVDTPFAHVFLAQAKGYFDDAGVKVNVKNAGANVLSSLTSGQSDLVMFGAGLSLVPAQAGKPTNIIYSFLGNGNAAAVAVGANSDVKSLADLSGKRVGVLGTGGSSFGFGTIYSKYVVDHGGQAFKTVSVGDLPSLVNSLVSGRIDAVVGTGSWFAQAISQHKARLLLDPTDPNVRKQFIGDGNFMEAGVFGLKDNLASKHDAVVRFIKAIKRANDDLQSESPQTIADTLRKLPEFKAVSAGDLATSAKYNKSFWAPTDGVIDQQNWTDSLKIYGTWNLPNINVKSPDFAYDKMIDPSFLQG